MNVTLNLRQAELAPTEPLFVSDPMGGQDKVRTGAHDTRGTPNPFSDISRQYLPVITPPAAKLQVTQTEAMKAAERIFANVPVKGERAKPMTLQGFERIPMGSIMLFATQLCSEMLSNTVQAKSKSLTIMSQAQERVRQQEMDKAVEQLDKVQKSGAFSVVFDWIIAAVELVTGVAKVIGGVLTANPMLIAGGTMDILAGASGVVKAAANTMALIDPGNAKTYKAIADGAGYVQMAFEIAGAVVDITSAARNMLVTKVIPKVAGTVLEEGAGMALQEGIKAGSKAAVNKVADKVGKEVASQVATQIMQGLGKNALEVSKRAAQGLVEKCVQKMGMHRMLEKFSQEAIEQLVSSAVKKVGHEAIDKAVDMTAKEITKSITKEINRDVLKATFKASVFSTIQTTRAIVTGASKAYSGVVAVDRASQQKEINQLIFDQQWLQSMFDLYKEEKETAVKRISEMLDGQSLVFQDGSHTIAQTTAVQVQIASAMV